MNHAPSHMTRHLMDLQRQVTRINRHAGVASAGELADWQETLERKLLTRLAPDFPLIAAICGGGSAGKSTLLNSRYQQVLSPAGGQAGLNRRVLAVVPARIAEDPEAMARLAEIMGSAPDPLEHPAQLTRPGKPLFVAPAHADPHLILLDTPDFDTGSGDRYTNRAAAAQALSAADLLVYIFTNATYNHRDNTDFIRGRLTELGMRDCMLVYRVYPSFSNREVLAHARTVAANIYGEAHERHVRGIFRVDEDNRVAAGSQWMTPLRADDSSQTLWAALAAIAPQTLRQRLLASMLEDVVAWAAGFEGRVEAHLSALERYLAALEDALARSVVEAVRQFPMAQVLTRFAELWAATDPPWMRAMRTTGRWLDKPVRWLSRRMLQRSPGVHDSVPAATGVDQKLVADLVQAANGLRRLALEKQLGPAADSHQAMVPVPAALLPCQDRLRQRPWAPVVEALSGHPELSRVATPGMDRALLALVQEFRERMGIWDKFRQSAAAFLNVLPASVAVTYILATADPVGAAGLKIKLTGLLGLHDLYALVALPATSGIRSADQQQLQQLLAPLAELWLGERTGLIASLLREQVLGDLLDTGRQLADHLRTELGRLHQTLETLNRGDSS